MDYIKSTDFAVKDVLPTGDPLKKVKGTEIDTEFNNIAEAIGTKLNKVASAETNNLPTFTNIGEIQDSGISSEELILDEDVGVSRADQIPRNEDLYRQVSVTLSSADVTLTEAQYTARIIRLTGTLSANVNVIFPATARLWEVVNNTTGNYTVRLRTSGQTSGVIIPRGESLPIRSDGSNITLRKVTDTLIDDDSISINKIRDIGEYRPGNYVLWEGDVINSTASSSYAKIAEWKFGPGGQITLKYTFAKNRSTGSPVYIRTYVDGVAYGPERSKNNTSKSTYIETITLNPGSCLQFYGRSSDGISGQVITDVQILIDNPPVFAIHNTYR